MASASEGTRGIRTLPDEGTITGAEATWVSAEASVGRHVYNETPSGAVNGSNTSFTLAAAPTAGTLQLYRNGIRLKEGASNDFTLSGSTITMNQAPEAGDALLA